MKVRELVQVGWYLTHIHTAVRELGETEKVFKKALIILCESALAVTRILLSMMEDHGIIPDDLKYVLHTFTGEIAEDHISLNELKTCVPYQKLLVYKQNLDSQFEREGARATGDKAATKERTYDAQATAEDVQKNAEGNAPVETKVTD